MRKDLRKEIVVFLGSLGMDDVGFADLREYERVKGGLTPQEIFLWAKVGMVYLYQMKKLREKYGPWYIVSLNNHLGKTNRSLARLLAREGYRFGWIGENEYDRKTLVGKVSFRQLAVLAGLGSIGKNQMLIHPKLGALNVIGVVFTDAPIKADQVFSQNLCTECRVCEKSCPVNAFTNGYDPFVCKARRKILGRGCKVGCIAVCPIGDREILRGKVGF